MPKIVVLLSQIKKNQRSQRRRPKAFNEREIKPKLPGQ